VAYLTRDAILSADDLQYEDVNVPEWGGTVRVRGLTGRERDAFEASLVKQKSGKGSIDLSDVTSKLIARTVVDEEGQRLFTDLDIKGLGAKSGVALNRVFAVAQRLSGLSDADVDELVGNSEADPSVGDTSD
jgi:hypothetical protein